MKISPRTVNIFFLLLFFVGLVLSEVILRLNGEVPGFIYKGVEEVDTLVVKPFYFADDSGVQKLTPYAAKLINGYVSGQKQFSIQDMAKEGLEDDLSNLASEFYVANHNFSYADVRELKQRNGLLGNEDEELDFKNKYESSLFLKRIVQLHKTGPHTSFDSLLVEYAAHPINKDGFRSLAFNATAKDKKRILLLGNSFTWGRSAIPLFNSFADILLAEGYLVFNTGIVSTDPSQYVAVMNEYFDRIQPDLVIINFSINDKMPYYRDAKAGEMEYHHTNAGLLSAYPMGYYMNPAEAYFYEDRASKIPPVNAFNRFCAKTAVTTKLWVYFDHKGLVNNHDPIIDSFNKRSVPMARLPVSMKYIDQVLSACQAKNVPCVISAIPDQFHFFDHYPNLTYKQVFGNRPYREVEGLARQDYVGENGDDHLNEKGHKKYAAFIAYLIDSTLHKN